MGISGFSAVDRTMKAVQDTVGDKGLTVMATKCGMRAKELAEKAELADLGPERGFSGWLKKDGSLMPLEVRFDHVRPGAIVVHPTGQSAGPWTVAEFGRNQAAGPRMVGPRLTKTGRVSKAKAKRWNGKTQPKNTASDALELIEREMPKVVGAEVSKAIRKFFN